MKRYSMSTTAALLVFLAVVTTTTTGALIDSTIYTNVVTGRDSLGNTVEVYYRLENLSLDKLPPAFSEQEGSEWSTQDDSSRKKVNAVSMKLNVKGANQQWLGLGLSPNGDMVGGEVVIGTPSSSKGQLYGPMTSQNGAGVQLSSSEEAQSSVIESKFTQDTINDETSLMITRTLNGATLEFDLSTTQILIWGASTSTYPSYHNTGRDSIDINWTTATKPTATTNLPSEDFALLQQPQEEKEVEQPEEEVVQQLEEEEDEEAAVVIEDETVVVEAGNEDGFSTPIELEPNLTMQQRLVNSETGLLSDADAIEFILRYTGSAWLALGVNPAGRRMPGSQVVIGKPLEPNVQGQNPAKYTIGGYSPATIELAPKQTLVNATISESNGVTTLRFVKLLKEESEHEILSDGENNFVFAVGTSASYPSIHQLGGRQQFQFNPSLSVTDQFLPPAAGVSGKNSATIFIAHGIMALVAWAFMAPFAAAASALRGFFPQGPMWFQFHRGLNVMTILVTIVAFIMAVAYGGGPRFNHPHYIAGWVIFFAALAQAALGIFRPHVNPDAKAGLGGWLEQIQLGSIRAYWEFAHKALGYSLLAVTIWQMSTGITLLNERYQTSPNYMTAYWSYIITFWILLTISKILLQFRSSSKDEEEPIKELKEDDDEEEEEMAA